MTALLAIVTWVGLVIQFYVTQTHPNLLDISPFQRLIRYFEYFTILTNFLVALSLTLSLLAHSSIGQFANQPSVRTAIAVYIALVGIVYNVILQGLHEFTGAAFAADVITHDLVPLLYVAYWIILVPKGKLSWTMPLVWLIYPLVYLPFVLIRGSYTGRYPYPFLDVGQFGLASVLLNSVMLTIVFLGLGTIFVGMDKSIAKLTDRPKQPFLF